MSKLKEAVSKIVSPNPDVREEDRIPIKEKIIYGAADLFGGGQATMLSIILLYFFTSIIGIDAGIAGTAIMIAKIWDAIIDPTYGVLTDNTRTKLGRRRPYIIAGGALIIPAMALLFAPIQSLSPAIKGVWATLAYLIYCSVSSLSQVPYNSMASDISEDYRERNVANIFKMLFDVIAAGLCFLVPTLLLSAYKSGKIDTLPFYLILVLGLGTLFSVPLVLCGLFVKERAPYDKEHKEKFDIKEYFGTVSIKSFTLLIVMYVSAFICMDVVSALALYYTDNILRGVELFGKEMSSIFLIGPLMVCAVLGIPLALKFMKIRSKQFAYRFGIPIYITGALGLAVYQPSWPSWLVPVFAVIAGFGFGGAQVMPWLIFPDTTDVAELKLGKKPSGSMGGIMTFCRTIATAFATAMVGWVLGFAGYEESVANEVVVQPDSVLLAIRLLLAVSVVLLLSVGFIAASKYKVTDKKLERIRYFNDKFREQEELTEQEAAEKQALIDELVNW